MMAEEYDPAFPTDEDTANMDSVDDDTIVEKKKTKSSTKKSKHQRKKKFMDNVLSDATVGSSSSSVTGTPSPPPPPPPPKHSSEHSVRIKDIPPPPPKPEMDLFSGLPPPKLEENDVPPPPPPPNKNGKHKVSLIEEPPPPPPPLPRRFDPYKILPQTVADELLLPPPPPPPPCEKPISLPKTKLSSSPPSVSSCQAADSSFDSTNLAFLSSPPPPPPPQPAARNEEWTKSICSLLAPPPPPPPPHENDNTAEITSSMIPNESSSFENKPAMVLHQNINDIPLPKECSDLLSQSVIPLPDSNTDHDCQKNVFVSQPAEQEPAKTGTIWKDSGKKINKAVNKKSPRASKWDIKPQFLQRIEEKQKLAGANQLFNSSTSESSEEKMFLELEKEMHSRKLNVDSSLINELQITDKHKTDDHEKKLLEDGNKDLGDPKSKDSNVENDSKKQSDLKSPTKIKKKKKGLEFKPFVIKMQNTTDRFSVRGPFQMKSTFSVLEEREPVVESTYHPPKHMTGKIPSMKLKAKQKAEKESKTTLDQKIATKSEVNSSSKSEINLVSKTAIESELSINKEFPIKTEKRPSDWTSDNIKSNVENKSNMVNKSVNKEVTRKMELPVDIKDSRIKIEKRPSRWASEENSTFGNESFVKESVSKEAVKKTALSFGESKLPVDNKDFSIKTEKKPSRWSNDKDKSNSIIKGDLLKENVSKEAIKKPELPFTVKEFTIKTEKKASKWDIEKTTVENKSDFVKDNVNKESIKKTVLSFNKGSSGSSFYGHLVKESQIDIKPKKTDEFLCDSLHRKSKDVPLGKSDKIASKHDVTNEFFDTRIANVKVDNSTIQNDKRSKAIDVKNKAIDIDMKNKAIDTDSKYDDDGMRNKDLKSEAIVTDVKYAKSEIKLIEFEIKCDSESKQIETKYDLNKCVSENSASSNIVKAPKTSKFDTARTGFKDDFAEVKCATSDFKLESDQQKQSKALHAITNNEKPITSLISSNKKDESFNELNKTVENYKDSVSSTGDDLFSSPERTKNVKTSPGSKSRVTTILKVPVIQMTKEHETFSSEKSKDLNELPLSDNQSQNVPVRKDKRSPSGSTLFSERIKTIQTISLPKPRIQDTEVISEGEDTVFSPRNRVLKIIPLFGTPTHDEAMDTERIVETNKLLSPERTKTLKTIPLTESWQNTPKDNMSPNAHNDLAPQGNVTHGPMLSPENRDGEFNKSVKSLTSKGHNWSYEKNTNLVTIPLIETQDIKKVDEFSEKPIILDTEPLSEMQSKEAARTLERDDGFNFERNNKRSSERNKNLVTIPLVESENKSQTNLGGKESSGAPRKFNMLSPEKAKHIETISMPRTPERTKISFSVKEPLRVTERLNIFSYEKTEISPNRTLKKEIKRTTENPNVWAPIERTKIFENTSVSEHFQKENFKNVEINPVSAPNQPVTRQIPVLSSMSINKWISPNDGVKKSFPDAGCHTSEVTKLKTLESSATFVSENTSNNSELGKQLSDSNTKKLSISKSDTIYSQETQITNNTIITQILPASNLNLASDKSQISSDDASRLMTQHVSIESENDDSNQITPATSQVNSDITENEEINRKGKRKRWHTDSESTQDEMELSSRGRRRSTRIRSLEDKRKESPKSEQLNKNKNNSSNNSSKEHSPVYESKDNVQRDELDDKKTNVIFTKAYLQQKLKMTPQVTDIPTKELQTTVKIEPCQSSDSGPEFGKEKNTPGDEEVEKVLTKTNENNELILKESKDTAGSVAKTNLGSKPSRVESVEELFEDESSEERPEILSSGLATSEGDENDISRLSAGNLPQETHEKHRAKKEPDYKAMGILKEHEIPVFDSVLENVYLTERKRSKASKEARRMLCECTTSSEDRRRGLKACDEDCLNRLLMIECSSRCPCGDYCTNKRFQRREYAPVGVFYSKEKGHGLKALRDIREGTFIMEYCGEVLNFHEFQQRVKQYNKAKQHHFYFMALKTDEIIDATKRGNTSRFINHSCKPNCETQKWTVNGSLRVGFFTTKALGAGEELTFDYQFEVYGEEAQKCYCGADNCRGYIGKRKPQPKGRDLTPRRRSTQERRKKESFEDISLDEEIEAMCSDMQNDGLQKADHALRLSRFMVRAETSSQRLKLLQVLQDTKKQDCLKYFLSHHGLALIWSWMVDLGENKEQLQIQILATLDILPIPHKNMLEDSKVRSVVTKWAQEAAITSKCSEAEVEDSSASETPSRAETPSITTNQNTPVHVKDEDVPLGTSDTKEETNVSTPVKEKSDTEEVSIPKSMKDTGEPPKKKLLRQLQSEGVLPDPQSTAESEIMEKKDDSGNKDEVPSGNKDEVSSGNKDEVSSGNKDEVSSGIKDEVSSGNKDEVSSGNKDEVSSSGDTLKVESDIESNKKDENAKNEESAKTENTTKESIVVDAESETKSSIAKAAASLLETWSTLKEIYIIPKLDKDKDRDRDRKDRDRYHDRDRDRDRNRDYRHRERSWERERSRYDRDSDRHRDRDRRDRRRDYRKRSRSRSRERDDKKENENKTLPKLRKSWKDQFSEEPNRKRAKELSKQERRQAFEREMEEQIQKKEEEKKLKEEFMQQQMMDGYYDEDMQFHFVDDNGFPIPAHYTMDPNCPDMPPFPMPFPEHMEPGMLPPPGMGIPPDGMMPVDGSDPRIFHHVDENGVPIPMPFGDPSMHHGPGGILPTPPPGQGMMPPDQMPHGWEPNHGPPIFSHQPGIQDHMLPPEHMVQPGMPEHMVPPGMPEHMVQEHMVADHIPPAAPWELNPNVPPRLCQQSIGAGNDGVSGEAGFVMRRQPLVVPQQAPAQAQTTTFITPDGMLITQTITPLADPNVHQLQTQLINQNLTPVAQASSTSMQTIVPDDIPSPPKPPPTKLPPNWKTATDSEGKVYYYHAITRQTQWDPPSWDGNDAIPGDDEAEMDLGTPTYDERKHRRTTTAAADTSSETAKKCKDHFRSKMSGYVVTVLNTYRKPECKIGRITNTEDFKHLARKLTHGIMAKELKHCKNMEDLEVNANVKHKAKEYIRKYMGRYGSLYRKEPD